MCVESRNKNGSPNTRMTGTKLSIGADEDLAIAMMPSCTSLHNFALRAELLARVDVDAQGPARTSG